MKKYTPFLCLALLISGCYNPHTLGTGISGRVTYKGKPIKMGLISFVADFVLGGRSASARIEDGWYSIPREDGPVPGKYTVEIVSLKAVPTAPGKPERLDVTDEIPERYNVNTELNVAFTKQSFTELMFDLE